MMIRQRAMVFIDGNNLYNGLRECYGIERLDIESFCAHIIQNRELAAIYYADANFIRERGEDNYARQQAYFSYLRTITGDADYIPAVDIVVREGKRVMNTYFDTPKRNSYALRSHCQGLFKNITRRIAQQHVWRQT